MIYRESCGERVSMLGMGNMRLPTTDGKNAPSTSRKLRKSLTLCTKAA